MRFSSTVAISVILMASPRLSGAQLPTPADMQSLIAALSGHWSLTVKSEPSKEAPNGVEGSGEETWHASAQGLTFTDEETFIAGRDTTLVVGLLWRDPRTHDFHAMDCSNEIPNTCDLKGALFDVVVHWTGRELTIDEKERSPQGKMMTSRIVWSNITANSFTETGYLGAPGGPFHKIMTILATRTASQ